MPDRTRGAGPADVLPGALSGGAHGLSFEVLAQIAVGSTARVDLARSLGPAQPGQLIAVKRLLPESVHDVSLGKRFLDEVWMTASLRHPNVVGVVGWGRDEQGPYLAVELVQGVSLARLMKSVFETGEQFPERLVVTIGASVARGLAAAHDLRGERGELLQLVHRDLSAGNVLVGFGGEIKITDFGLAKAKDRLAVTTSDLPKRPIAHIAPEELEQRHVDHRSDLFALGVMLFELLVGRSPFEGKDELSVLEAVVRKPAPDPSKLRPRMDARLSALVLRLLEKDPALRPPSAGEVARELDEWLYAHGYVRDAQESLARFVRRNSMRQMRWFERVVAGQPEPAPAPFFVPRPSLYQPEAGASTSAESKTNRRDAETTLVDGRSAAPGAPERPRPPPLRRTRSADTVPAAARARSPEITLSQTGATHDTPILARPAESAEGTGMTSSGGVPNLVPADDGEDIPTIALRVDPHLRAELRQSALARPRPGESPAASAPTSTGRAPMSTLFMNDPQPVGAQETTVQAHAGSLVLVPHIEREIERLRAVAEQRHELAKGAREAARRAALDADRAEADARQAERAIATARHALELALRGHGAEAGRKLEEAAGHLGQKPSA